MIPELLIMACFIFAGYMDFKYREVENVVWILMAPIAAFMWYQFDAPIVIKFFTSLLVIAAAYAYWNQSGIGGADAKGIMIIGVAYPSVPMILLIMIVATIGTAIIQQKIKDNVPFIPALAHGVIVLNMVLLITNGNIV